MAREMKPSRLRLQYVSFLMAGVGAAVVLYAYDPLRTAWFPPCPIHKLTGLDCPGCGSARGLHALLHGQILRAADYNLLLLPALVLVAVGCFRKTSGKLDRLWQMLNKPKPVLIAVCLFWLLRNIPLYPLSWLSAAA